MRKMFLTVLTMIVQGIPASAAVLVDFEDLPNDESSKSSVDSRGFHFMADPAHLFYISASGPTGKRLITNTGTTLTITQIGGGAFQIDSLDLGGTTSVTGFLTGGGSISQTFAFDGNFNTMRTFQLMGFVGLSSAVFQQPNGGTILIDNIVVPEPGAVIVFASAALLIGRPYCKC